MVKVVISWETVVVDLHSNEIFPVRSSTRGHMVDCVVVQLFRRIQRNSTNGTSDNGRIISVEVYK